MKSVKLFFATLSVLFLTVTFLSLYNNYQEKANEELIESAVIPTQENINNMLAITKEDAEAGVPPKS